MSEIIDVLALTTNDAPAFTPDTGGVNLSVNLVQSAAAKLYSSNAKCMFQAGDNFTVLSAGVIFPECFVLAQSTANNKQHNMGLKLRLRQQGTVSPDILIPTFDEDGIQIPMENYELPLGVFCDVYNVGSAYSYPLRTKPFVIMCYLAPMDLANSKYPRVSMIGVPTSLNGIVQNVTVFVKILHNLPILAEPV